MSFLDVFLKVIAILGIIAVGTFIIVFLSDLLISVIDNSNGIFFKRNKNANNDKAGSYNRPKMITQQQDEYEALTYEEPKQEPKRPVVKEAAPVSDVEGIDYERAREEERLAAKANAEAAAKKQKAEEDEKTAERLRLIEARRREFEEAQRKAEQEEQEDEIDEDEIRRIIENASAKQETAIVADNSYQKEIEEKLRQEYEEKEQERQRAEEEKLALEERLRAEQEERQALEEQLRAEQEEKARLDEEARLAREAQMQEVENSNQEERDELQRQIEELRKQLEEANSTVVNLTQQVNEKPKTEVVYEKVLTGNGMTKEEIEDKLAILRQRLKANEKELSLNKKDFLPLKRVNMTLASDEKKLRRKEALVAKKKVMLYGVNNYVDIDEEKAKELAEELDLLEGLKLSVQHCEQVMKANKDRYPILEKANKILTKNVADIKADIEELEARLAEFPADDDGAADGDVDSIVNDVLGTK